MISGGIDLSVGMLASLVSIIVSLGISKWQFGVGPSILLGVASAIVLETIMGFIISRTRIEPFIITKYGRRIYAVGTNPRAAFLAGIGVSNMRLSVYTIQGLLVGIGATMLLARINTGIITLGQGLEIDTIAMVVIGGTALSGGKGNIVGTLIGVLFLGSIANAMNMLRLPSEVQFLVKGLVVIIAVTAGDVSSQISEFRALKREQARARKAAATSKKGGIEDQATVRSNMQDSSV
jgi:ribose/xylose/arabinose/galactoside ABC-type transport system permease subunit